MVARRPPGRNRPFGLVAFVASFGPCDNRSCVTGGSFGNRGPSCGPALRRESLLELDGGAGLLEARIEQLQEGGEAAPAAEQPAEEPAAEASPDGSSEEPSPQPQAEDEEPSPQPQAEGIETPEE